jgi:hypothetical protein
MAFIAANPSAVLELIAAARPQSREPDAPAEVGELIERLRVHRNLVICGVRMPEYINPDGPEAAATLERQAAENKRLRSAGAALLAVIDETDSYQKRPGNGDWGVECACCMGELFDGADRIRINIARAALTGEDCRKNV